jgi:hypothetical protein
MMNSFKLFPIGCKMVFLTHILSFSCSIATAMQRKKAFIWFRAERIKITQRVILANEPAGAGLIFRFNQKSLNEFNN